MPKKIADFLAVGIEKIARKSAIIAADSRCMYVLHQPKQPKEIKNIRK